MIHSPSRLSLLLRNSRPLARRLAAIGLVFVAMTGSSFAAGLVFSDDFESGNTSKWAQDSNRNKCVVVSQAIDGGTPAGGSNMAECNWDGVAAWDSATAYSTLKLSSVNYSKEFLIRFKVRYATDVDRKFGSKMFRLMSNDNYYMAAQLEQGGGPMFSYFETIDGKAGPMTYGDGSGFGDGKWHEVEIYVKHNDSGANGVVRVWQDGRVIQQASNIVSVTPGAKWFPMYIMSNWTNNGPEWAHDSGNHVYWDNFEIFSDAGTGGSGTMADGTISSGGGGTSPPPPPPKTPSNPTNTRTN